MTTPPTAGAGRARAGSLRAMVAAVVNDPARVSGEQRKAVEEKGNFLLEAGPGSGKTRTVGLRLAWAAVDGSGRRVAALSHTNVAVREIRQAAAQAGVPVGPPHLVTTLHTFLLRFVFFPFGHLVMGCASPPRVVDEATVPGRLGDWSVTLPRRRWDAKPRNAKLWEFEFRADGRIAYRPRAHARAPDLDMADPGTVAFLEDAARQKRSMARQGLASTGDAVYYAMRVLEERPDLAAAVASRFHEIIVDEVQDTSDVQLRCLELLWDTGRLRSLVLAGDFDQAIYGFAGADPELPRALAVKANLGVIRLTTNFRSSPVICSTLPRFSSSKRPCHPPEWLQDTGTAPELYFYDPGDREELVERFLCRLKELGILPEQARILTRERAAAERFNGLQEVTCQPAVRRLGQVRAGIDRHGLPTPEAVEDLERLLAAFAWEQDPYSLDRARRDALRRHAWRLALDLPALDLPLSDWVRQARAAFQAALGQLTGQPAIRPSDRIRKLREAGTRTAREVFGGAARPDRPLAQHIHTVKGESYDAVLVVAEPPRGGRDEARAWLGLDGGSRGEEPRVLYVALTRARRYLALALPEGCSPETVDAAIEKGFVPW